MMLRVRVLCREQRRPLRLCSSRHTAADKVRHTAAAVALQPGAHPAHLVRASQRWSTLMLRQAMQQEQAGLFIKAQHLFNIHQRW